MFISYITEAFLVTVIILQTCWHNWKHRNIHDNTASAEPLRGRFIEATDTFLDNAIVFLLSLVVALVVVGSHETVLYNGIITDIACYFAASALIAVASMPRRGSSRNWPFWGVLLICILLLIVATRLSGQYDMSGLNNSLGTSFDDEFDDEFDWLVLSLVPALPYSVGASDYLNLLNFTASSEPFTITSCLIYGLLYYPPSNLYFIDYLYASVLLQEVGYFGGILLFFLLTKIPWPRQFIL